MGAANKLNKEMIGNTYLYNGEQHTVQRVEHFEDDLFDVYTDKRRVRISKADIKEFKPVHVPMKPQDNTALILAIREQNKPIDDLATKLNLMIDKIEAGVIDIHKAKAINETARSIIAIGKARIELIKVAKG